MSVDRKMNEIEFAVLVATLLSEIAVAVYMLILLNRTQFLARQTSIGGDVIWIVNIVLFAAFFAAAFVTLHIRPMPIFGVIVVSLGGLNIAVFAFLLASGKVGNFIGKS